MSGAHGRGKPRRVSAAEVASWFHHPKGRPWPTADHVGGLVATINDTNPPDEPAIERSKQTTLRLRRVQQAIEVLTAELPVLIAAAEDHHRLAAAAGRPPWRSREGTIEPAQQLLNSAIAARRVFLARSKGKQGRKRDWVPNADVARLLALGAWRAAGCTKPLGYHRTGPLVSVISAVLDAMGTPTDEDAISKWLEERSKGAKK
ncbi:MAG TPA: hypothetical protein PK677_05530 [Acidiphilium sp.]|nr:MAG: hypothetical protein B7Z57_03560 [Acidiphilium sp. 37-60-79]HQT87998.1 hypothetical protein [Acidiphilium sp.]HQU23086.1 hypothetical protein [Acidiphilium sp.]